MINYGLKLALMKTFPSQVTASEELNIAEGKLSRLVRGHVKPNERERKILAKALGQDYFAKPSEASVEQTGIQESV